MNGRCETNPLDPAINVCDSCYGEFCDSCLVNPGGRKHPICRDCALAASGVRGRTRVSPKGSRKSAKERRKKLKEAGATPSTQGFQYFDEIAAPQSTAEPSPPPRTQTEQNGERATSAVARLEFLREHLGVSPSSPPADERDHEPSPAAAETVAPTTPVSEDTTPVETRRDDSPRVAPRRAAPRRAPETAAKAKEPVEEKPTPSPRSTRPGQESDNPAPQNLHHSRPASLDAWNVPGDRRVVRRKENPGRRAGDLGQPCVLTEKLTGANNAPLIGTLIPLGGRRKLDPVAPPGYQELRPLAIERSHTAPNDSNPKALGSTLNTLQSGPAPRAGVHPPHASRTDPKGDEGDTMVAQGPPWPAPSTKRRVAPPVISDDKPIPPALRGSSKS